MSIRIINADVFDGLGQLPDASVNCCVTSPPYFGLRSYDENAVRIDPKLDSATRDWLEAEMRARGIHAR